MSCKLYQKNIKWSLVKLCILWIFSFSNVSTQDPVANLAQGRIVGIKVYTENALTPIEIFFGIPYATPPTGRYRFSAPERHSGWRRTFFAHRTPPRCPQVGDTENDYVSEDCLFLNIWTPRRADGKPLPVVVILYSETWVRGGTILPCQELAAEGIVVVTVAYRLHLLAFFTLRSIAARGNMALLDQYLALLWIRENIAAFGGDPTAITLVGHSAGASSILHHIASPRSLGLFQRAIIMSPHDPWKFLDDTAINASETERISREVARSLGCASDSDQEILHCMRSRPLSDIISLYSNSSWSKVMFPIPDTFLTESEQYLPVTLLTSKQTLQLDLLLGYSDLDSLNNNDHRYEELTKGESSYLPDHNNNEVIIKLLKMFPTYKTQAFPVLTQAVRWQFWDTKMKQSNEREALKSIEALARAETSATWGAGMTLLAAKLARRVNRIYFYRYSQPAGMDLHGQQSNYTGAVHGTDLVALLGDALMLQVARRPATTDEKRMSSHFRKLIVNFVKFGSPGIDKWQQYTRSGEAHVYDIRDEDLMINAHDALKDITFWLQYLPQLSNLVSSSEHTEQLTLEKGESRLRGGVFAMCGVSVVLLLLLLISVVLLRKERAYRSSGVDSVLN